MFQIEDCNSRDLDAKAQMCALDPTTSPSQQQQETSYLRVSTTDAAVLCARRSKDDILSQIRELQAEMAKVEGGGRGGEQPVNKDH